MDDALDDAAMSAIKEFLASERADFISLRELLEAMTNQGKGCSLQEAANVLLSAMDKENGVNVVTYSPNGGIKNRPHGGFTLTNLLIYVSKHGKLEDDSDAIPF